EFGGCRRDGGPSARIEILQRADRRAQDGQAQFPAEQRTGAIDVRDVAQHPRPETERVERQAVACQRRLALRAADQIVPIIAVEVLPRDLDELMQVLETKVQEFVRHGRGYLVGWKTGSNLTGGRETGKWARSASHSAE